MKKISIDFSTQRKLIAVLRHIAPEEVEGVCDILVEEGITIIEVTVNSQNYEESLRKIVKRYPVSVMIGSGTVITEEDIQKVHKIGVSFVVSPHTDPHLITQAKSLNLFSFPGFFTPSEAFAALKAGADVLKFFPASWAPPSAAKDLKAILPAGTMIFAIGGVGSKNFSFYRKGGYDGFGIGSSLFHPGIGPQELRKNCREIVAAYDKP